MKDGFGNVGVQRSQIGDNGILFALDRGWAQQARTTEDANDLFDGMIRLLESY